MRWRMVGVGAAVLVLALGLVFVVQKPSYDEALKDWESQRLAGAPRCDRDADCPSGSLCACRGEACAISPSFSLMSGTPDRRCFSREFRLDAHLPIRVDGGWTVEADPRGRIFVSHEEAGSAALELTR